MATTSASVRASRNTSGSGFFEGIVRNRLEACGININGKNRWDPQVHDSRFYFRVFWGGMLGLGDSYVDGSWDCDDLPDFFDRTMRAGLLNWGAAPAARKWFHDRFVNRQDPKHAVENVLAHYKERDELVRGMTDKRNAYSCAFWKDPLNPTEGLDAAQDRKLELVCQKLDLDPSHSFLDIGCGWGSLVGYASEKYGVYPVGITPAKNQAEYIYQKYGPTTRSGISILVQDYRWFLTQRMKYDRIASVGMFEHVGEKNLRTYMEVVSHCLADDGIFVLHFFGRPDKRINLLDTWTDAHIFPGICLPTIAQTNAAAEGLLECVHLDEWGRHYDPTLLAWAANFEDYAVRTGLKDRDPRLYRLWMYYLKCCAGGFRSGKVVLWQMVFKKPGTAAYTFIPDKEKLKL